VNRRVKYLIPLLFLLFQFSGGGLLSLSAAPLKLKGRYDYSRGWYHRVGKGDTIYGLAKKYKRSIQVLVTMNGLDPGKPLKQGAYVYIPPENKIPKSKGLPSGKQPEGSEKHDGKASPSRSMPKMPPFPTKYLKSKKVAAPAKKSAASSSGKTEPGSNRKVIASSATSQRSSRGYLWPLKGTVTRGFSNDKNNPHKGMDIAAPKGMIVRASRSGKVIYSDDEIPGYGKLIIIDHGGDITTVYAHNSKLLVEAGKPVGQGWPIALVGSTGHSTGPHLHFEIRKKAIPIDPRPFLP